MSEEIRLEYPKAEDMRAIFQQGATQLEETAQTMEGAAAMLEEGALLGLGGAAFVEAIRGKLSPSLTRLIEKFRELDGDVQVAIEAMREADVESAGKFA